MPQTAWCEWRAAPNDEVLTTNNEVGSTDFRLRVLHVLNKPVVALAFETIDALHDAILFGIQARVAAHSPPKPA